MSQKGRDLSVTLQPLFDGSCHDAVSGIAICLTSASTGPPLSSPMQWIDRALSCQSEHAVRQHGFLGLHLRHLVDELAHRRRAGGHRSRVSAPRWPAIPRPRHPEGDLPAARRLITEQFGSAGLAEVLQGIAPPAALSVRMLSHFIESQIGRRICVHDPSDHFLCRADHRSR